MRDSTEAQVHDADLRWQVAAHLDACRQRIPRFVNANFAWPGAIRLSRLAFGFDILVAPLNFLMGFPNFLLRVLGGILDFFGARKTAKRLHRSHLGLRTRVQQTLTERLTTELLDLPIDPEDATDETRRLVALAAREPVKIYVQTRNVAADITAGTLAAVTGILFFHQFTPGSISTGSAVADLVARERAVSEFPFGQALGQWYYSVFPASPSLGIFAVTFLLVIALIAVVAALSGIIHDPIQAATGIHQRRLGQLIDAIEDSIHQPIARGYRPKDTFFGRVYDLVDWVKGLLF